MSEFIDEPQDELPIDPFTEDEVEDIISPEPDAGTIAFLDQEEAEWEQGREEFKRFYGFDHDCTCSQDYSSGKTGTVTQCFMKLTSQALAASAQKHHDLQVMDAMLTRMVTITQDLARMLEELGHTDELEKYFGGDVDENPEEDTEPDIEAIELEPVDDEDDDAEFAGTA